MQEAALAVIADPSPKAASRRAQKAIQRLIMGLASS
jgi:hypothetical protein